MKSILAPEWPIKLWAVREIGGEALQIEPESRQVKVSTEHEIHLHHH